jgi:hypothetical protein
MYAPVLSMTCRDFKIRGGSHRGTGGLPVGAEVLVLEMDSGILIPTESSHGGGPAVHPRGA